MCRYVQFEKSCTRIAEFRIKFKENFNGIIHFFPVSTIFFGLGKTLSILVL